MVHVIESRGFTGHIGKVRFLKGHADTKRKTELRHFAQQPDRFTIVDPEQPDGDQ